MHINISPNEEVRDGHTRQIKIHTPESDRVTGAISREFNTVKVEVWYEIKLKEISRICHSLSIKLGEKRK